MKTAIIRSQTDVLTHLLNNFPALHPRAELERDWVWLAGDYSGEHNKELRLALVKEGWQYKSSGDHTCPSGAVARWAHHCLKPIPRIFRRRSGGGGKSVVRRNYGNGSVSSKGGAGNPASGINVSDDVLDAILA